MILVCIAILTLYWKTYKYKWNIDDHVSREGYLWVVPPPPVPVIEGKRYDDFQRSYLATFVNISTFICTCWVISLLWGWKVALIYAVMPTNVSGVAWGRTGNYYMSTVFLVLASYYFFLKGSLLGILVAYALYYGALHSTLSAFPFWIICCIINPATGWTMFFPFLSFLCSTRFRYGLRVRKEDHERRGIRGGVIHWSNIVVATKCLAYYLIFSCGFMGKGFFHSFGSKEAPFKVTRLFWLSGILLSLFLYWGLTNYWFPAMWFILFMGVFCHFPVSNMGQFVSERYVYLPNVAIALLLGSLQPSLYWLLIGLWYMVAKDYIKAWRSNETLFSYGICSFPTTPDNYVNLASYYIDRKAYFKALNPLKAVERFVEGSKSKIYLDMAVCFANLGDITKVKGYYVEAKKYFEFGLWGAEACSREDIEKQVKKLDVLIKGE